MELSDVHKQRGTMQSFQHKVPISNRSMPHGFAVNPHWTGFALHSGVIAVAGVHQVSTLEPLSVWRG